MKTEGRMYHDGELVVVGEPSDHCRGGAKVRCPRCRYHYHGAITPSATPLDRNHRIGCPTLESYYIVMPRGKGTWTNDVASTRPSSAILVGARPSSCAGPLPISSDMQGTPARAVHGGNE